MARMFPILVFAILATWSGTAAADIYAFTDANGVRHITNVPHGDPRYKLIYKSRYTRPKGWSDSPSAERWRLNPSAYEDLIRATASQSGIDHALIRAIMHAESGFNPQAVSPKGAMGLMQLMPATAARFGVNDSFNPIENVRGGVAYLRFLLDLFKGDVRLAVAAYNAGEGAVQKFGGIPPYDETITYVARVMNLYGRYRAQP
ncbi:MAG: lytic transglycosylase domain-containing protein [Halothiobacillaceae bacterium]